MKHLALIAAAGSLAVFAAPAQAAATPAERPAAPAQASIFAGFHDTTLPFAPVAAYGRDDWDDDDDDWRDRRESRRYRDRDWNNGRRAQARDYWRGDDGRYYCRRKDGTTGLLIGAGVGALLGRAIDTRGDRSLGTILGAVGGGLLGREVDRGEVRCR